MPQPTTILRRQEVSIKIYKVRMTQELQKQYLMRLRVGKVFAGREEKESCLLQQQVRRERYLLLIRLYLKNAMFLKQILLKEQARLGGK